MTVVRWSAITAAAPARDAPLPLAGEEPFDAEPVDGSPLTTSAATTDVTGPGMTLTVSPRLRWRGQLPRRCARIADAWRAGVADDGHRPSARQTGKNPFNPRGLIVLVQGEQAIAAQRLPPRCPWRKGAPGVRRGVFTADHVRRYCQEIAGTRRDIAQGCRSAWPPGPADPIDSPSLRSRHLADFQWSKPPARPIAPMLHTASAWKHAACPLRGNARRQGGTRATPTTTRSWPREECHIEVELQARRVYGAPTIHVEAPSQLKRPRRDPLARSVNDSVISSVHHVTVAQQAIRTA